VQIRGGHRPFVQRYCDRCVAAPELARRRQRRLARRTDTVCQSCGATFTPPRAGAAYCSSACRQKAYRRRCSEPVAFDLEESA
jgi:ferredoxin